MSGTTKRLIVNADDFGWSRGITDGILDAHHKGIVTSTSFMVNRPASEYALELAKGVPGLSVGIHLTLSDGRPVLPAVEVPTLVNGHGAFPDGLEVSRRLRAGKVSGKEVEAEFRAQIRWMKERGVTPTHADSHQHLHLYLPAGFAFRRALKAEGITRMRPARNRYFAKGRHLAGQHGGRVYRQLLVASYMLFMQEGVFRGLRMPERRLVFQQTYRSRPESRAAGLEESLQHFEPGTYELVCHPAIDENGFSQGDPIREERVAEYRLYTSSRFRSLAAEMGVTLISYREL